MIIAPSRGFAFLHIPKCAGSSIRAQLAPFDEAKGRFWGVREHAVLGRVDHAHLPLWALEKGFPEVLETLRPLELYALCRDPHARFRSSISEYVKRRLKISVTTLDPARVEAIVEEVVDALSRDPATLDPRLAHFTRQSDYVSLHGDRIVRNLYPLERLADMFADISKRIGGVLDPEMRLNETVDFRFKSFEGATRRLAASLRRRMSTEAYVRLKQAVMPWLSRQAYRGRLPVVSNSPRIEDFVERHYADDIELYRGLVARADKASAVSLPPRQRSGPCTAPGSWDT